MKILLLVFLSLLTLSGCATGPLGTSTSGGANYVYANGDCQIGVNSARELIGVSVEITENCALKVTAEDAGSEAMDVINGLVEKLP